MLNTGYLHSMTQSMNGISDKGDVKFSGDFGVYSLKIGNTTHTFDRKWIAEHISQLLDFSYAIQQLEQDLRVSSVDYREYDE